MKKIIILIIFIFLILTNTNDIINSIILSFDLCINNIFPSSIPFLIFSVFLIEYNFLNEIIFLFKPIIKLLKINKYTSFVLFLSLLTGSPSTSIYLNYLYEKDLIDESDIQRTINYCHFTNPLFVIGIIGKKYLNSTLIGIYILFSQYLSSFIIGLFTRKNINYKYKNIKTNNNISFFNTLKKSIFETSDKLLLIMGVITFFLIITTLFNINNNPIVGLLEITQGLNVINNLDISIKLKSILFSFIISFGGLSIHFQTFSILNNKKIRYKPYLICRIIQALLASLFISLVL